MPDPSSRLEADLGAPLPPGLAALTAPQQEYLADAILRARAHQAEALETATAQGLDFIPRLLRGPVRKVLFG